MASMRLAPFLALLAPSLACTPTPTQVREPASGDPSVATAATSASPAASSAVDAGPSQCEKAHTDELVDGVGACTADADCELSSYQQGCCTQACSPSAKNKADVARARNAENCAEVRKRQPVCPPPAPCRTAAWVATAAVCCAGTCMTARRAVR
ncbi:MAG TPA: hypothetical protein VF316_12215 [Polyangiaceae bacterium]